MTGLPMSWKTQLVILLMQLLCQLTNHFLHDRLAQKTFPVQYIIILYREGFYALPPGTPAPLALVCLQRECRSQGLLQSFCKSRQEQAARSPLWKEKKAIALFEIPFFTYKS